jgi:hypothetical protein
MFRLLYKKSSGFSKQKPLPHALQIQQAVSLQFFKGISEAQMHARYFDPQSSSPLIS